MSFQICIKTEKSLQQLATEIRNLFSCPRSNKASFQESHIISLSYWECLSSFTLQMKKTAILR